LIGLGEAETPDLIIEQKAGTDANMILSFDRPFKASPLLIVRGKIFGKSKEVALRSFQSFNGIDVDV